MAKSFKKCLLNNLPLKSGPAIRVRRTPILVIPWRISPIDQHRCRLHPGPQLHQRMNPQIQMKRTDIRPVITKLLLADSFDSFQIVIVLLDGKSVRHHFQDLASTRRRIGTQPCLPRIICLSNHHNRDDAARRSIRRLKLFHAFRRLFASSGSPIVPQSR